MKVQRVQRAADTFQRFRATPVPQSFSARGLLLPRDVARHVALIRKAQPVSQNVTTAVRLRASKRKIFTRQAALLNIGHRISRTAPESLLLAPEM